MRNTSLITVASPCVRNLKLPQKAPVHGKLAAFLALNFEDEKSKIRPWQDVWPKREEFETILPIMWEEGYQGCLPVAARELLQKQKEKLDQDWETLQSHLPGVDKALFTYTWLLVNTRTFYWSYPDLPRASPHLPTRRPLLTASDCYALCPFIDYFNHSDSGCTPSSSASGYAVTADRDYKAGDEVYVSYGPHTNDFLLVEYGFILGENGNDSLPLDGLILEEVGGRDREVLKGDGFLGGYTLLCQPTRSGEEESGDEEGSKQRRVTGKAWTCHRTQAVLRLMTLEEKRYTHFISGRDEGERDQAKVDKELVRLLKKEQRRIGDMEEEVEGLGEGEQRCVLKRRWRQIRRIVGRAVEALDTEV